MDDEKVLKAIKTAREGGKKRNFKQSFDIAINLKNVDLKKPENKIKTEVSLPHTLDKPVKIGFFADNLIPQVKKYPEDVILIKKDEIESYGRNKKAAKVLANTTVAFLAEAPLMPLVGKWLGQVLAVRGKMPKPVPPTIPDIGPLLKRTKSTIRIAVKDSPVIHCRIGVEDMDDDKLAKNGMAVISAVESSLPKGREQIKNVYVKLTMGKPVKVEM